MRPTVFQESNDLAGRWLTWRQRRLLTPYLFLLPVVILLGAIIFYPLTRAIGMAFQYYVLTDLPNAKFIGLGNFERAFSDKLFLDALGRSVYWVAGNIVLQLGLGLTFASILNQEFPLRGVIRSIILIPWVTPSAVTAIMWRFMLDGQSGLINDVLVKLHIIDKFVPFLSRPETAMPSVIVANVWFGVPFFAVMLLAALQAIPQEMYEAAEVDGAATWHRFRYITLPLLMPTILVVTLLRTIWLSQYVEIIYLITGGGPAWHTTTLPVYSFIAMRADLDMGYASASSICLSAFLLILMIAYLRALQRQENL